MKSASKTAFLVSCVLTFLHILFFINRYYIQAYFTMHQGVETFLHLQLLFKIICLVGILILGVTQVRKKPNLWFPYTGLFLINLILS
ncbi:MAG: hypothetical protein PWP69_1888 [Enterococcus sp.]|nr:hypothetical protein [Enterococcus sp.]